MILTVTAVLLLQQQPVPPPPRDTVPRPRVDTIYIRAPGDSARAAPSAQPPVPPPSAAPSATPAATSIFDSPATRALVERVIQAGSSIPAGLDDYEAHLDAAVYLSLRADSAQGGELPVTVDELAGDVKWARGGGLLQRIRGHRVRMLAPTPYTIGTLLDAPWV